MNSFKKKKRYYIIQYTIKKVYVTLGPLLITNSKESLSVFLILFQTTDRKTPHFGKIRPFFRRSLKKQRSVGIPVPRFEAILI